MNHVDPPVGADKPKSSLLSTPTTRKSLGETVADRLRQAILASELLPGQHLREEDLANTLAVSRGPLRDAFVLLEREGLIVRSSHRGAAVVRLSTTDLGEVYSLRAALETLAMRLAIRRHTPDDLLRLEHALTDIETAIDDEPTDHVAARIDVEFHDCIYLAAHHDRLYASWQTIRTQVYWFLLSRNIAAQDWRDTFVQGHAALLELIRDGDEERAVKAIEQHMASGYERLSPRFSAADNADGDGDGDGDGDFASFLLAPPVT